MSRAPDRYPNKRLRSRKSGRFAKAPSLEQMGFDVNDGTVHECAHCGERWIPLLRTGKCPRCLLPANEEVPR